MLGDWLVVSQVLRVNPAAAVRGPKQVVTKGSTPVLSPAEARKLLEMIDTGTLAGLRDRALLSVMLYSIARVSAILRDAAAGLLRAGEPGVAQVPRAKGGKRHDVPAHHRPAALVEYVEAAGLEEPKAALFQSVDQAEREADGQGLQRRVVLAMIKRRCRRAAAVDVLPHVPGDGDHGVPVERGNPRARAADRGTRVAEDDEALRPHGGHGDGRRDRAYRDLKRGRRGRGPGPRLGGCVSPTPRGRSRRPRRIPAMKQPSDLDVVGSVGGPSETDAPLRVDLDAGRHTASGPGSRE